MVSISVNGNNRTIKIGTPIRNVIEKAAGDQNFDAYWDEFRTIVGRFYETVEAPENKKVACNGMSRAIDMLDGIHNEWEGNKNSIDLADAEKSSFEYFYIAHRQAGGHEFATLFKKGSLTPLLVLDPILIDNTGQRNNADPFYIYSIWTWEEYRATIIPVEAHR